MNERRDGEPTLGDVQREFPGWSCWKAVSGLYHARRASLPPGAGAVLQGEDPLDLRDQIRRAEVLEER